MKRRYIATALMAAIVTIGTSSCSKQESKMQPGKQTSCPVMKGEAIDPNLYVDVNGKRIYVCCPGCITTIKAEPEKYIKQMEAEGIVLEKAPAPKEEEEKAE